ncbi:MAG: glycosyltransferase family 39 protein [Anaerolineae bacterium]|nr:glycosyltransferase family 39 protein [Anaerolineae bacterium]
MSDLPRGPLARWLLPAIILIYLVLGTLYAAYTPAWQAPDEPAHYNYIRHLAERHRFPILKPGDFPAAYLEEIKAARFPPEMGIEPIRYEFHQPPLYYVLAVPIYGLFGGSLLPLRLLSVVLGALLLLVVYWTVEALVPDRPSLALGTTAFVAFLPMHLAMTASVNNDILSELLLAVMLLLTIRFLQHDLTRRDRGSETRLLVLLGITTGLGLLTKSSLYIVPVLVLAAIAARKLWLEDGQRPLRAGLQGLSVYLLPSLGLALPWWLRNMAIYGGFDFLGLGRHDQVVVGQLRTADFVAQFGLPRLLRDFVVTSFHSFWGQFGWMGVLLDQRLYQALVVLSALAGIGFLVWFARIWRQRDTLPRWQWLAGGLLVLWAVLTLASYAWYNTTFLQHQGRYLFRALLPIGLGVALGWREALRRTHALPLAGLFLLSAVLLRIAGWLPNWPLLMVIAAAVGLGARYLLPRRFDPFLHAMPYLSLILLDLASLFLFVVPQLAV